MLLAAGLVFPGLGCGETHVRDRAARGQVARFGIGSAVADQDDLVDSLCHDFLLDASGSGWDRD